MTDTKNSEKDCQNCVDCGCKVKVSVGVLELALKFLQLEVLRGDRVAEKKWDTLDFLVELDEEGNKVVVPTMEGLEELNRLFTDPKTSELAEARAKDLISEGEDDVEDGDEE